MTNANQNAGVHVPSGRHTALEAAEQNADFFTYREAQREHEAERLEAEAEAAAEEATRSAATRAATKAAFENR